MEMPSIYSCEVTECAYNKDKMCHALGITIGDSQGPMCDTFLDRSQVQCEGGDPEQVGHVGACRMSDCVYNERLECSAGDIAVGHEGRKIDCLTYNAGT